MATIRPMSFGDVANFYMSSSPSCLDGNPWAGAATEIARLIESDGHRLSADQVLSLLAIGAMAYREAARREAEKALPLSEGSGTKDQA